MPTDVESIILEEIREARKDIKLILLNGCSKALMHDDMERRVRSIEADRNRAVGIISFISLIFGAVGAGLFKLFGSK